MREEWPAGDGREAVGGHKTIFPLTLLPAAAPPFPSFVSTIAGLPAGVPALTCAAATWTPLTSTYVPSNCYLDATGTNARFHWPQGVVLDGLGNLLIADRNGANIMAPAAT